MVISGVFALKVGFDMKPDEEMPLNDMLKQGLEKHIDQLKDISSRASKEFALEKVSVALHIQREIFSDDEKYFQMMPTQKCSLCSLAANTFKCVANNIRLFKMTRHRLCDLLEQRGY